MFGDDPDPTVTTARVGSGEVSEAHERSMHGPKGGRLGLGGLWRAGWSERRGERCTPEGFPETENVRRKDRLYCRYSYPLGHQTNSECDETWQVAYLQHNNTAFQLSTHYENIFRPLIK